MGCGRMSLVSRWEEGHAWGIGVGGSGAESTDICSKQDLPKVNPIIRLLSQNSK